jgi:protein transport protein YIF1
MPWMGGGGGGGEGAWPGMNDATTAMGMQFGSQALHAGSAYIDKNLTRLLPLAHLKFSFNVSNGYVLNKLRLVLWPWRHRPWARGVRRSEQSGVVEGWKPPREDINCPDLYIPGEWSSSLSSTRTLNSLIP